MAKVKLIVAGGIKIVKPFRVIADGDIYEGARQAAVEQLDIHDRDNGVVFFEKI